MLGEYGSVSSGSEISDSDDEFEPASSDRTDTHHSLADQSTVPATLTGSLTCKGLKSGDPLDYAQGDTLSSSEEDSEGDNRSTKEKDPSVPLPLPDLYQLTSPTGASSVFSNPFKEAEDAKLAILRRHVSEFSPDEKQPPSQRRTKRHGSRRGKSRAVGETTPTDPHGLFNDDDSCVSEVGVRGKRKQRSGVGNMLMPPKKYLKSYEMIQAKERPWTVNSITRAPK